MGKPQPKAIIVNGPIPNFKDRNTSNNEILKSQGLEKIILKPILEYGAKLMHDKIIVKNILSDTEFVVYCEELRTNLILKQIAYEEDLAKWIKLPQHTNIASVFDTFEH